MRKVVLKSTIPCLQLSELNLDSTSVSFPLEDLPLGPCSCEPLLERYKVELQHVREELERRVKQLDMVSAEMETLHGQQQKTLEELNSSSNRLQETLQEKTSLEEEVRWRD